MSGDNQETLESLQDGCCHAVLKFPPAELQVAVHTLPGNVVDSLLSMALHQNKSLAVQNIISVWPRQTLCLRQVLPAEQHSAVNWRLVFNGVVHRQKSCRMTCLDLRGVYEYDRRKYAEELPILSLAKSMRADVEKLVSTIIEHAEVTLPHHLEVEFAAMVRKKLLRLMGICGDRCIEHLEGDQIEVKMDSLSLWQTDSLWDNYLMVQCLRTITPVKLHVSKLITHWACGHYSCRKSLGRCYHYQTTLQKFIRSHILHCHDPEIVESLDLEFMSDGLFLDLLPSLSKFRNLRILGLGNAFPPMQVKTRNGRNQCKSICDMLSSLPYLHFLNLSDNDVLGYLGEILNAVQRPLEYLLLNNCRLEASDLENFVKSKHARSLLKLSLRNIKFMAPYPITDKNWRGPRLLATEVIEALKGFPHLDTLNIFDNCLTQDSVDQLCSLLQNNLQELKELQVSMLWSPMDPMPARHETPLRVCQACGHLPSLERLEISLVTRIPPETYKPTRTRDDLANHVQEDLSKCLREKGREDVIVECEHLVCIADWCVD